MLNLTNTGITPLTSKIEPLPCPFCGKQPATQHETRHLTESSYVVQCATEDCILVIVSRPAVDFTIEDVVELWNVRAVNPIAFTDSFNVTARLIHNTARSKGFWDIPEDLQVIILEADLETGSALSDWYERPDSELLALIHSEVSEALEAIREGIDSDDKIPEFTGLEAELADVVIRVMDMAHGKGLRVAEAIVAKMKRNQSRERLHGKRV